MQLDYKRRMLDNAEREARLRGIDKVLVVDADAHHLDVTRFLAPYVDPPYREVVAGTPPERLTPRDLGDRYQAGRLRRIPLPSYAEPPAPGGLPAPVQAFKDAARRLGIDYSVIFPTDMLALGLHPDAGLEVALARAYARWLAAEVLPNEPSLKSMLYLPFGDPEESLRMIEEFGETDGAVGFMVTSCRHQRVFSKEYWKVYAALAERGLPIGFHSLDHWRERPIEVFDQFLAAHALGFPLYNMLHLTNLVMNGIPQRFPGLRFIFFEAGVAWIPLVMCRLDTMYGLRPAEAPRLEKKPSEYMREFFYTTQPLECPDDMDFLRACFDMAGRSQFIYSSDYPHWDFDLPTAVWDLPFLSDDDRRDILGRNAVRAFGLKLPSASSSAAL